MSIPFDASSAPAVFQKTMIPSLKASLVNIPVRGSTLEEHLKHLAEVLDRLAKHGLRLKQVKCSFMQDSVEYLGHHIDVEGIHTLANKVEAIVKALAPKNITELRSFF